MAIIARRLRGFLLFLLVAGLDDLRAQDAANLTLLKDAAQSILAGELDQAEAQLHMVLLKNPDEFHALNFLGVIRAQQQKAGEAEALFKQVIAEKPEFIGAHLNLGHLYEETKRDDDAISQFQEAVRLDPTRSDAVAALVTALRVQAHAAVESGDSEKALALLLHARRTSPQDPQIQFEFGMTALQMSLFPDAIEAFGESLTLRQDDPDTLYALGRAQIALSKLPEAKASFQQFVQLRPGDASGHYALGLVLQSLQEDVEARRQFEKSAQLQPAQTEAYFQLGLLDLDAKHLQESAGEFDRVLQRNPKHAGALFGMGRVFFEKRDYPEATTRFDRAIAVDSSLRQAHYYLGLTYSRLGRKEDSERELATASKLEHDEVEQHRVVLKILDSSDAISPTKDTLGKKPPPPPNQ